MCGRTVYAPDMLHPAGPGRGGARCRVSTLARRRYGARDRAFECAANSQRRTMRVKSVVCAILREPQPPGEDDGWLPVIVFAEFLREQLAPVGRVTIRRGRPEGFAQADMGIRQVA